MGKIYCYGELLTKDLRTLAKSFQIPGYSKMARVNLISTLDKLDPAGKCVKTAGISAAAVKPVQDSPKKAAPAKEVSAPKKGSGPKSSAVQALPAKKGKSTKESSQVSPRSVPPAVPSKTPSPKKEPSAPKSGSAKKEVTPPKAESSKPAGQKTASPIVKAGESSGTPKKNPKTAGANTANIIPSKLRMGSAPPLKISPPAQDTEKKSKRRRASAPRREDVTVISMPSEEAKAFQDETAKDITPADSLKDKMLRRKTLETPSSVGGGLDRIVLQVCGPFWLHAWWEISGTLISRVRAAMGHLWHTADPILRLYRVSEGSGGRHTNVVGDYVIHGGVYNWFLNVDDPPGTFLVEIGYLSRDRQFFSLVSSNTVVTPQNYIQESMGWSESAWNMLTASTMVSPFEGKTINASLSANTESSGGNSRPRRSAFSLAVDAEVVIKGQTSPDAQLTVRGERIFLRDDGTFLIRYHLPERRHVFPVAAVSRDGIDTKTIVLSVERNTKNLETVVRPLSDDD